VGGSRSEFADALKGALGVRARIEPKPAPVLPANECDLLPPEVARSRRERQTRRQRTQLISMLAAIYVIFFAAWAGGFSGAKRIWKRTRPRCS